MSTFIGDSWDILYYSDDLDPLLIWVDKNSIESLFNSYTLHIYLSLFTSICKVPHALIHPAIPCVWSLEKKRIMKKEKEKKRKRKRKINLAILPSYDILYQNLILIPALLIIELHSLFTLLSPLVPGWHNSGPLWHSWILGLRELVNQLKTNSRGVASSLGTITETWPCKWVFLDRLLAFIL